MVERRHYVPMISAMPYAEKDRHILAAAIASRDDVLVAANRQDFRVPAEFRDTNVQHSDEFLR